MKHIGWLITAGVLIIALVLGIVIWYLNKNDEEDSYNISMVKRRLNINGIFI